MRLSLVLALCVISAAIGAGIDHYCEDAVSAASVQAFRNCADHKAVCIGEEAIKPSASEKKKVEVLGDRVRCDVRFTELGLPVSEYRSFFDKCMGSAAPSD
jgi:hypothetical protein